MYFIDVTGDKINYCLYFKYTTMVCKLLSISIISARMDLGYSVVENYIVSDGMGNYRPIILKQPTIIDGIAFMICTKGTRKVKINGKVYEIRRKTLITTLPGFVCETIESGNDYFIEYLFFSTDFAYELNLPIDIDLIEKVTLHPVIKLTKMQFDCLLDFVRFIAKHYKRENHTFREQLAKNLLKSFITEFSNIYSNIVEHKTNATGRKAEIFKRFCKLLKEYIMRERTVLFYADKICVSPKHLSQIVKDVSGKPIKDWINGLTISIIKSKLKTSEMSISQISEELNFPNSSFMGHYFKKHTGITPSEYRRS